MILSPFAHAALVAVATMAGASSAYATAPPMSVILTPGAMDVQHGLGHLDVTLKIPALDLAAGAPVLGIPLVIANTDTIAATVQDLKVTDSAGQVPLTVKDDNWRHWLAGRPVKGDVTVTYRAPIDNTPPLRGSGPPYSLRTEGGGFSGVGNTFILLPAGQATYRIALRWKLAALGPGASATSSYGEGDVDLEPGPADRLASTVFMAGPLHREPVKVAASGFSSAWLGSPPFEPRPLMDWTEHLHGWMSRFFQDKAEPPYRVFLRFNPINAGGGTALTRSFLVTYGQTTEPDSLKLTLSHEMIHTWVPGSFGHWYAEGTAVHYQALLPLRAGLITTADYLEDLNSTARRYYSNSLNGTPDDQIEARFWEDSRIRVLPYDRGSLYLDLLDAKIRKATSGARSLDDVVLEINRREAAGVRATDADFVDLIAKYLGDDAPILHKAMKSGALILPDSDAFGPCFVRTTGKARPFDIGFEPKSLVGAVKTIRGLEPESAAARAGLQNGDVVTYSVALDGVQSSQSQTLTLKVTRNGKTFPITYLPRGEVVDVYQWVRVPGVSDNECLR
jgi:predicted metalloprotease with PDZ domain